MDILHPVINNFYAKMQIIHKNEVPFLTTTEKSETNETSTFDQANLLENISVRKIPKIKRKTSVFDNEITFSDLVSKKVKFEFLKEKKFAKIVAELIPKEICISKKALQSQKENTEKIWGTDFSMISFMLPTKNRTQIKKKFRLEDRKGNERIGISFLPIKKNERGTLSKEIEDLNRIVSGENDVKDFPDFKEVDFPFKNNDIIKRKLEEIINEEKAIFTHKQEYENIFYI